MHKANGQTLRPNQRRNKTIVVSNIKNSSTLGETEVCPVNSQQEVTQGRFLCRLVGPELLSVSSDAFFLGSERRVTDKKVHSLDCGRVKE